MENVDYAVILQNCYARIKKIDVEQESLRRERSDLEGAMRDAVKGIVGEAPSAEYRDEGIDVSVYS